VLAGVRQRLLHDPVRAAAGGVRRARRSPTSSCTARAARRPQPPARGTGRPTASAAAGPEPRPGSSAAARRGSRAGP
jgi:hypothetical protein